MINLNSIIYKNYKKHNEKWPFIPDHLDRILITGGSGSRRTNALLNLTKEQDDIDKIYLYARDLSERKYEFLIKKHEDAGTKNFSDPTAFIQFLNTMNGVYKNIDDYNPNRQIKILIAFDDMIAYIISNKKFQSIVKEFFIRCRKLNISLVFITFCFKRC